MTEWNTKVIAVSDAIRQQLLARGVSDDKIEVIRNFVDVERFHKPELRAPTRQELGIPEDAIVVLNVGRMVPQKGQADFLEVAARCLPEDERLHFLLVGDGPLEEDLKAQVKKLGLSKTGRLQMLPFQKDIERIYAASDILLHTAYWDPLANVLLEAMAAGLAIVATDVDGTREKIENQSNGFLFSAGHIEKAANFIFNVAHNDDLRAMVAQSAQDSVEQSASPRIVISKFINIFRGFRGIHNG
jgi:glycosyltransferase involved in cell wall biosynthesis